MASPDKTPPHEPDCNCHVCQPYEEWVGPDKTPQERYEETYCADLLAEVVRLRQALQQIAGGTGDHTVRCVRIAEEALRG